jgi:uncharacterized membrane protein YkvA (DUF1232 family)
MMRKIGDAPASKEFEQVKIEAEKYLYDQEKTEKLIDKAKKKFHRKKQSQFSQVWQHLAALIRMIQAYICREYTDIPWESVALSIAAVIYFVSPVDLIPDFILSVGHLDDAAIIAFVIRAIRGDLDKFMQWEAEQKV